MTRAERILGAMMAMGAGLGDIGGGGNPHRERYDWWCKRRGFGWSRMTRIATAELKRARKAAKRRRDAELTRLGQRESRLWWEGWVTRNMDKAGEAGVLRDDMRAIRCGEVQP